MISYAKPHDRRGGYREPRQEFKVHAELCTKPSPMVGVPEWSGWIRDASDERARDRGCWFDPVLGGYSIFWIERYCRLYEGTHAGEPAKMWGCKECSYSWTIPESFSPEWALERNEAYCGCVAAGHEVAWQYDFIMRLFGWMRQDEEIGRPVRRFRKADLWIPKKNAKSPTLAFLGWHLLCGDGVPGQKVYFGAKDGAQAREIVGGHAVAVYDQSPEIKSCTRHNRNQMEFSHEPSRSTMKPLSSSNTRTMRSKEGINGSVLIDEVHVVDAEFMQRIRRAGISREEPLLVGVSTAGLDTLGYGKSRQDYGRAVAEGIVDDDDYLFVCYEADPKTDLDSVSVDEVVEVGRRVNPNWGITIREREFRSDFAESKQSTHDQLMDFGTYRLNLWQYASSPWLRWKSWQDCEGVFDLADLAGRTCMLGLDCSRTRDMTAAVFVFQQHEGRYDVWPLFWLPEDTIAKNAKEHPEFSDWAKQGYVISTPRQTISYQQVLDDLTPYLEAFDTFKLYYDVQFADWISEQIEIKFDCERVEFPQTLAGYSAPTDQFEQWVLDGAIRHPNHPVLNWQIRHCHVHRSRLDKKQKRPVRPVTEEYDVRTVDGVQAAVMATEGIMTAEEQPNYYEEHELESF